MTKPVKWSDMERSTPATGGTLRRALLFLATFVRNPKMVGTFAVSSPALVRRLVSLVDWTRCHNVVELGPGVGTITRGLLDAMPDAGRLLALETSADFVAELGRSLPDPRLIAVHGSAEGLASHLSQVQMGAVDLVVSGIPFSTMPAHVREGILDAVAASLAPEGCFLVYQYTGHVEEPLRRRFAQVERTLEWRNLVPVRIFRCRQPLSRPA